MTFDEELFVSNILKIEVLCEFLRWLKNEFSYIFTRICSLLSIMVKIKFKDQQNDEMIVL